MRVKTIRCAKKEEFDSHVNTFLRALEEQGGKSIFMQITHHTDEFIATIVFEELHTTSKVENPDFVLTEVNTPPTPSSSPTVTYAGKEYANIDAYEKY